MHVPRPTASILKTPSKTNCGNQQPWLWARSVVLVEIISITPVRHSFTSIQRSVLTSFDAECDNPIEIGTRGKNYYGKFSPHT